MALNLIFTVFSPYKAFIAKNSLVILFLLFSLTLVWGSNFVPYLNIVTPILLPLILTMNVILISWKSNWLKSLVSSTATVCLACSIFLDVSFTPWILVVLILSFPRVSSQFVSDLFVVFYQLITKITIKHSWKVLAIFTFLLVFCYYRLSFQSYFEGDEWVFFRFYAPATQSPWWFVQGFLDTFKNQKDLNVHMSPLANMIYVIQYKLFKLDFTPYLIFSILTHACVSLILGWFTFVYSKSKRLAIVTALIFASLSTHSQAVTWVVASVYTQFAVGFGLLSLIYLKFFEQHNRQKDFFLSLIFLLLALWSKETAIIFLIIYPFLLPKKSIQKYAQLGLVIIAFLFTQKTQFGSLLKSDQIVSQPFLYTLIELWQEKSVDLTLVRVITFTIKISIQSFFPTTYITELGRWLSDYLFPYFVIEKKVGGTNYLMFIQTAVPEFISLAFGLVTITFWKFYIRILPVKTQAIRQFAIRMTLLGLIPIMAIAFRFPWWAYTPIFDSRHFYHITPFVSILLAEVMLYLSTFLHNKHQLTKNHLLIILLIAFTIIQYVPFVISTKAHQKGSSFTARKKIVQTLLREINPVPDKLLLYTTSNRSYYGFAQLMLPFQTAVSHMLPVIFSSQYHPQGQTYSTTFFNNKYMKDLKGGLVTQGYFEDEGKGIGYFLEDILLIQAMEKEDLSTDSLFAFRYDGDDDSFINITEQKRQQIKQILDSRKIFADWKSFSKDEWFFKFQYHPNWTVEMEDQELKVMVTNELDEEIISFLIFPDMSDTVFSQYVTEQEIEGKVIDDQVITRTLQPDLDKARISYSPAWSDSYQFVESGNGQTIYQIHINPQLKQEAELLLRTIDFED